MLFLIGRFVMISAVVADVNRGAWGQGPRMLLPFSNIAVDVAANILPCLPN
jgi:hypothetical protein